MTTNNSSPFLTAYISQGSEDATCFTSPHNRSHQIVYYLPK